MNDYDHWSMISILIVRKSRCYIENIYIKIYTGIVRFSIYFLKFDWEKDGMKKKHENQLIYWINIWYNIYSDSKTSSSTNNIKHYTCNIHINIYKIEWETEKEEKRDR